MVGQASQRSSSSSNNPNPNKSSPIKSNPIHIPNTIPMDSKPKDSIHKDPLIAKSQEDSAPEPYARSGEVGKERYTNAWQETQRLLGGYCAETY